MDYKVSVTHINSDLTAEPPPEGPWEEVLHTDEALVLLLNRVAVATTQTTFLDIPQVEITVGHKRATVSAIAGQLFYNDAHSKNHQNLKVIADEVLGLLADKPLEEIFTDSTEDDKEEGVDRYLMNYRSTGLSSMFSFIFLLVLCSVIGICGRVLWLEFSIQPSLIKPNQFIPILDGEAEIIRKYSDIYVNEYREGGSVFEIDETGLIVFYELWYSEEVNGFVLKQTESFDLQVGTEMNEVAMLAGEYHLLLPKGPDLISLHDLEYKRLRGQLGELGQVVD